MPVHDFACACGHREIDRFWATWREVPVEVSCPACGAEMTRMAGRFIGWGPASVFDSATGDVLPGPGRALVPGAEIFAGTPLEEAAKAGETVNPYLPEDHPGYYKRGTGYRVFFT